MEDRSKPLTIEEIEAQSKTAKPLNQRRYRGFPIGVGDTGISLNNMDKQRQYNRNDDTEEVPNGEVIGARVKHTPRRF